MAAEGARGKASLQGDSEEDSMQGEELDRALAEFLTDDEEEEEEGEGDEHMAPEGASTPDAGPEAAGGAL